MEKIELLLDSLEPEIEKKCMEIRQKKREKVLAKLFVVLMAAILILPPILVFTGVNGLTIIMPILFIAAGFVVLSPLLMSKGVPFGE